MEIKIYDNYLTVNYKGGLSSTEISIHKVENKFLLDIFMYSDWKDDIYADSILDVEKELKELEINQETINEIILNLKKLMQKIVIQDKYNESKKWEIIKISGGYYLKQYISNKQYGKGLRTTKSWIENILNIKIKYNKNIGLIIE